MATRSCAVTVPTTTEGSASSTATLSSAYRPLLTSASVTIEVPPADRAEGEKLLLIGNWLSTGTLDTTTFWKPDPPPP
ncbi:hypothetical protein, partial [Gemmatimonas sp.]|uniref:hypothetical protein n=1 Tax=Gemmatimonas sp. TaxID=1962908 RepID=UPI0025BDA4DB